MVMRWRVADLGEARKKCAVPFRLLLGLLAHFLRALRVVTDPRLTLTTMAYTFDQIYPPADYLFIRTAQSNRFLA